ncbi:hypothetical protein C0989_011629 [Termitomyces sp. Mn162]|nr:hypothetical protein C0989_011629 [Termitomyces sp. Mn162]
MPCDVGVVVLLHNPLTELWNIGDIDAVSEGQDSILEGPFVCTDHLDTSSVPQLQCLTSLSHKLLLLTVPIAPPYVLEDLHLHSIDGKTLHGPDCKQLGAEEHNVAVISFICAVVCFLGQGIQLSHAPARLVVQGEVKVGKVEGPPGLLAVELFGCPEIFEVLLVSPDLKLVPCALQEVHFCSSVGDDQAKILNLGLFKLTLLWLEVELVLVEVLQDETSDLTVFLQCFGVDENVVEVHAHYTLCDEVPEDVVHHGLEGGGAIGESKEHNEQLKQSPVGLEGSLPLISFLNMHIVVTPLDVQFSEVSHSLEVVDELGDEWEGFDGMVPPLALQKGVKGGFGKHVLKHMQVGEYHILELSGCSISSKSLGQSLAHSLASPDLCNRGWE